MENSPSTLDLIVIRQGILAEEFPRTKLPEEGKRWYWLRRNLKVENKKKKWGEFTRESPLNTFTIYFGEKESLCFFFFFPSTNISPYRYIHRDIYVIASSTRPISSDGKNNGVGSSSGLYLTFFQLYDAIFTDYEGSVTRFFFYLSFPIPFPSAPLACSAVISQFFFLFLRSTSQLVPPYHLPSTTFTSLSSTRTDEPAIRICLGNLCRLKIYRFEIHRRKHDSIKGTS